ncbi:MAG: alpha/beta fold hydrolase [Bacteroidota bacterium]
MIERQLNTIYERLGQKPLLIDTYINKDKNKQPLIIFCHGYKGYKDWGAWSLMALEFAKAGYAFIKFNFSHNGGTMNNPIDFPDLEAFGHNNYSKELNDLGDMIDWCMTNFEDNPSANTEEIILIGHSRGGGMVVLKAAEDARVKRIISLAGVSDYKSRFPQGEDFKKWKEEGVTYVVNGRTKQNMPHYFQYYEDFITNEDRLTISKAAQAINCPMLIIQGTHDDAVKPFEAKRLKEWYPHSELFWVEGANHVFGMKQPWEEQNLPEDMQLVIHKCLGFLA